MTSTCHCSDLVAATHGRGYWILDDVTPLRQAGAARAATTAYLFKPEPALRVRFGTNDPTPWPPELPAGENPPTGAIIDYYLPTAAQGDVTLDILDASGEIIRSYSSDDPIRHPDPALDSAAYNRLCQKTPDAPDCALPLYWPAPPNVISTEAGMHRVSWDLRYAPIAIDGGRPAGGGADVGAVPHRTAPVTDAPWAPPGAYTVRLTAGGKTFSQPLALRLDPRVKTLAAGLAQLAALTHRMYEGADKADLAYLTARALVERLDSLKGSEVDAFKAQVESLRPRARARCASRTARSRGTSRASDARERERGPASRGDGDAGRGCRADDERGRGVRSCGGAVTGSAQALGRTEDDGTRGVECKAPGGWPVTRRVTSCSSGPIVRRGQRSGE